MRVNMVLQPTGVVGRVSWTVYEHGHDVQAAAGSGGCGCDAREQGYGNCCVSLVQFQLPPYSFLYLEAIEKAISPKFFKKKCHKF